MKEEIKELRKCQKVLKNLQYPGYPFQLSVIVDIENDSAYVNYWGKKTTIEKALYYINQLLIYQALGHTKTTKGTWLIDQKLAKVEDILNSDYEDFYIDNLNAVKMYFALNSAIYSHKKNDKVFIFAVIDEDTEYVDVKVFDKLEDIKKYYEDYYKGAD